jgi:hypothetical protein
MKLTVAWLGMSVLWIAGYLYVESLDGQMLYELGEIITMTLLPPSLPPLLLTGAVHVLAGLYRP